MKKVLWIVVYALLLTNVFCAHEKPVSQGFSTVSSTERAKQHPIVSNRPAVDFFEGAVLGNGGLGVIVNTRPDAVVIHFGHNDVWDIRLAENNREKVGTFQEIFEKVKAIPDTLNSLIDNKWYRDYIKMARENYAKPYPRPFPCGSVILWFDRRNVELLGHRVNINNGVCEINFLIGSEPAQLEVFADMTEDRLWVRMVDKSGSPTVSPFQYVALVPDPETPPEFPRCSVFIDDKTGTLSFRQILPYNEKTRLARYKEHPRDKAFRLTARVGNILELGGVGSDRENPNLGPIPGAQPNVEIKRKVDQNSEFVMCVQLDDGKASDIKSAPAELPLPSVKQYAAASMESKSIWENYWNKSGVVLDDEILERTWYWNLYFFRCALRPGVTCPGLFANWSYRKIASSWHGDYHMNYNTQQPFWVAFSSNHVDLHLPYVDMVINTLLPISRRWAKEYYNMRGAFFPHSAYPVEMTIMPYPLPTWGWEICETPWSVQSLWWHYTYTMDKEYLKNVAFRPIKEAVLFLVDYMKRPEAHGEQWGDDRYHIFPSVPPELYGLRPGFDKNHDVIVDLTLTRFVFNAFTEACGILGCEQEEKELIDDVENILAHFPDYPRAHSKSGKVFVSVEGEDPEIVYNCPVSLMTVFPGEHHGLHSSADIMEVLENTFRNQQNEGGNDLVFLNVQAARLGMLDLEKFKRQIEYCLLPNGTCTDKVLQTEGRYTNNTPFDFMADMAIWFENFALPFVINECMLQSYTGELRFFPNWPDDKDAEFRTLRTAGAFLVSAKWSHGKVQWIEILSEAGEELNILSPWETGAVCRNSDGEQTLTGERFTVETTPGERLQFIPNR